MTKWRLASAVVALGLIILSYSLTLAALTDTQGAQGIISSFSDEDGDTYGNGSDNCPSVYNPGQENLVHAATFPGDHCDDPDADAFVDYVESWIGTDPDDPCGYTPGLPAQSQTWPPDLMESNSVNISDVLALKPVFGSSVPPTAIRLDIAPGGGINISDVLVLKAVFATSCAP